MNIIIKMPNLQPAPAGTTFEVPPGMVFTGKVVYDTLGNALPVFEPAPPPPGKLSINTLEGWNALCRKSQIEYVRHKLGREPTEEEMRQALSAAGF